MAKTLLGRHTFLYIGISLALIVSACCLEATAKEFVVVIDAGHGGHDPGAIGKISKEKDINLDVALKLGIQIKLNCPDVKVVYTREKDVFVPLDRRAEIANRAKADLFISIHTNALPKNKTYQGASTWTLGLAKSDANLEVAKRENGVILYENDYQTRYAGFNPNSAESYIIFEFMQDKYMEQSVHLASLVQSQFKNTCRRMDRGVHQAGFLVLKASAMPSILIELGFISTPAEEKYLNSKEGTTSLANGIFRAFLAYKKEQEARRNGTTGSEVRNQKQEEKPQKSEVRSQKLEDKPQTTPKQEDKPQKSEVRSQKPEQKPQTPATPKQEQKPQAQAATGGIVFKIQFLTSSTPLGKNDKRLKGLTEVDYYKENGLYKYTYGADANYNKVLRTKREITAKFSDAFIIAFRDGKKMNVNEAIREFKSKK